jgi:serine protease Do
LPPRSKSEDETSSGSAFVVSARGHLLTNNHVVEGCDTVAIAGIGPGTIASRDVANDLALILARPQSDSNR